MMTVRELIAYLEVLGPDVEVRLATQPNWPFECSIAGVVSSDDLDTDEDDHNLENGVIYLIEGSQLGYTTKRIWDAL